MGQARHTRFELELEPLQLLLRAFAQLRVVQSQMGQRLVVPVCQLLRLLLPVQRYLSQRLAPPLVHAPQVLHILQGACLAPQPPLTQRLQFSLQCQILRK